ncbi:MAG: 4-alpha-glucanotransferase, partial [Elusimicrobiota bacterium]
DLVERKLFWKLVSGGDSRPPVFSKAREKVLALLLGAGSRIVILPIQDIFGSRERVNTPGTLGGHNWTYRFPTPAENFLKEHMDTVEAFAALVREKRK